MNATGKTKLKQIYPLIYEGKGYDKKTISVVGNLIANNYNSALINFTINDKEKIVLLHCAANGNLFSKEVSFKDFVKKITKIYKEENVDKYVIFGKNKPVRYSDIEKKLSILADEKDEILISFETDDKTRVILYKTVNQNCVIIRNSITYDKFLEKCF